MAIERSEGARAPPPDGRARNRPPHHDLHPPAEARNEKSGQAVEGASGEARLATRRTGEERKWS